MALLHTKALAQRDNLCMSSPPWPPPSFSPSAVESICRALGEAVTGAAGASALIARMEPASVFLGRQALQRARAGHREAVRREQADAEAATVTRDAWLGFVRSYGAGLAGGQGQRLVQDSVIFAGHPAGGGQATARPCTG